MSSGITINVKGQELIERCETRAAHHRERAKECEAEAKHHVKSPVRQDNGPFMTANTLQRKTRQHRERADALVFLARHLEAEKVYEVTQFDLRNADLWPDTSTFGDWLW